MYFLIKNLVAAAMLLLIISHGIIQYGMFELIQNNHRTEVENRINKGISRHQQIVFSFDITDYEIQFSHIEWKADDEFRLNGKMYDIIKTETRNDSVYLYCLFDSEESILYSILNKLIEDDSENSDNENVMNNYFSHFYSAPVFQDSIKNFHSDNNYFEYMTSSPLEGELMVTTPPPRV